MFKQVGPPLYHYPTLFSGKGKIHIEMAQLGVIPSPYFYNTVGYIEARNSSALVTIKDHTIINNNFVIIIKPMAFPMIN